jgi:hypothetical protein
MLYVNWFSNYLIAQMKILLSQNKGVYYKTLLSVSPHVAKYCHRGKLYSLIYTNLRRACSSDIWFSVWVTCKHGADLRYFKTSRALYESRETATVVSRLNRIYQLQIRTISEKFAEKSVYIYIYTHIYMEHEKGELEPGDSYKCGATQPNPKTT